QAAAALGLDRRVEVGVDDQAAVRAGETDVALDGGGEPEVLTEGDRHDSDLVIPGSARAVGQEAGDVPDERGAEGSADAHRRTGSSASSSSYSAASGAQPFWVSCWPSWSSARRSDRRASSRSIPRLMLCRVLTTSPSRPTSTLTAYSSAPRRISSASSSASAMMRRVPGLDCWVRPRSTL